jgi:hypothetical protein
MSFISITDGEIALGQPVSSTTQGKIKTAFDDHEARILSAESGSNIAYPACLMEVNGRYDVIGAQDRIVVTNANFNITIIGVRLIILKAGTSPTLSTSVGVSVKSGGGGWHSLLATPITVPGSAGDNFTSTAGTLDPTYVNLNADDWLAVDLIASQPEAEGFIVRVDYIKR